tara:strand:- start:616 stop:1056 length:441 start_codon:yes stop_codon:yes gene_type:complete
MKAREWYDKFSSDTHEGVRFWISGREFGRNATARCGRCVRPTQVELTRVDTSWGYSLEFRKVSTKTNKPLSTKVSFTKWSSSIQIFEDELECKKYWEASNNELAINALKEAAKVADEYLKAFDRFNKDSGRYEMNREDAIAIMKIL